MLKIFACDVLSMKHDVSEGNHCCVRWNVHLVEMFYAITKVISIHPTTNFYARLVLKNFARILNNDSMHPIGIQVISFKF
jgi:hypothetical protein